MKYNFFISVALLLSSCQGFQYITTPQYVPLHEKKDELKAVVSYNTVQLGYSVSDHVSLFITGNYRNKSSPRGLISSMGKESGGESNSRDKHYDVNIGAGYFTKRKKFIIEALAGAGAGRMEYGHDIDLIINYYFSMAADKYNVFVQPSIGCKVKNILEVAVFSRFNYVQYNNINTVLVPGSSKGIDDDDKYFNGRTSASLFLAEPGALVRVGFKNVKFSTLVSPAINLTGEYFKYRKANVNFGIALNFDLLKRKH